MDFYIGGGITGFVTGCFSVALLTLDKWIALLKLDKWIGADLQTKGETDYNLCLLQVTYLLLYGLFELKIFFWSYVAVGLLWFWLIFYFFCLFLHSCDFTFMPMLSLKVLISIVVTIQFMHIWYGWHVEWGR